MAQHTMHRQAWLTVYSSCRLDQSITLERHYSFSHASSTDVGLAQYPAEEFSTNVFLMRIWYPDGHVPADHELMPPTRIQSRQIPRAANSESSPVA